MDKLSKHAIRMLEIVDNERGFYKDMDGEVADIARAVYDTILQVQMLKTALLHKTEPNSSEKPNNSQTCANCKFDHKEWFEEACDSCCDAHSNWQPKTEPRTCENRECKNYDTTNDHCMFIEQCRYEPKTEPTRSKMEQVDKDTNVRSKEPQTERSK